MSRFTGEFDRIGGEDVDELQSSLKKKKRETGPGRGVKVGVEGPWRVPKRPKDLTWGVGSENGETMFGYCGLKASLMEVCSFEDLKERMRTYLSLSSSKEIFDTMTQVTRAIDEGRLKMRSHCPMVTDVGMKERSMRVLMNYNPIWLRIGLYIILGGDSLLPNGEVNSEQEMTFLKMVLEKQFFSHPDLAKAFAYNKLVDGLYRPGYYEKLGAIILKRFLLLVLILDRAKHQSSLPLKYGIDGLDGGSPLLFSPLSNIKSSRQMINDFLPSDMMHGEGNLLAHLMIVGYKMTYQQGSLVEYNFRVTDLFEDLQDGVRLCRAIQLLQHDSSILLKMVVPSDTQKKFLVNCGIALQYLKQAGVSLCDEDGMLITEEDVANREKELVILLLWNMFVHLQLPLLISKQLLSEEITKIRGVVEKHSSSSTILDMLLGWIQAIGENYDSKIENFSSLVDGKAMWCLLDYYFRKEHRDSSDLDGANEVVSLVSTNEYTDAVHNFILSQKLTSLLGNFPEVLQVSDLLEHNRACNERSVVILLVFLSFQLLVKRNTDQLNFHKLLGYNSKAPERKRLSTDHWYLHSNDEDKLQNNDASKKFKAIMAWWQEMAQQNNKCNFSIATLRPECILTGKRSSSIQRENAAKIIQSHFRRSVDSSRFTFTKKAVCLLQTVIRAWLFVKLDSLTDQFGASKAQTLSYAKLKDVGNLGTYMTFLADRHYYVKLKKSVLVIQQAVRAWIFRRHHVPSMLIKDLSNDDLVKASIVFREDESNKLKSRAATTIQKFWRKFTVYKSLQKQRSAATKIQSHLRSWLMRKSFKDKKEAISTIQSIVRCSRLSRDLQHHKQAMKSCILIQSHVRGWIVRRSVCTLGISAILIQSHVRGWIAHRNFHNLISSAVLIQSHVQGWIAHRNVCNLRISAIRIQSHVRGWIARRSINRLRSLVLIIQSQFRRWMKRKELLVQKDAAIKIQNSFRSRKEQKAFFHKRHAAIEIQRFVRGEITKKKLLGASCCRNISNGRVINFELKIVLQSVLKIQRWWRSVLVLKLRIRSAIIIQFHFRGWTARKIAARERHRIRVIQAYWKGYIARKNSRGPMLDLRLRVQKSAANVHDSMRLINRLIAAVSELLSMKSVSGILHTCATLDMATEHSQRCCEELVAAGAVSTLLKLIRSVSRSIPDQEILKHILSTLRNLARYPHLTTVLIDTRGCVEIILWELIRNKEEGYFIACEVMKKMCLERKGIEAVQKLPALLKRLHNLVEDLAKKAAYEKRKDRALTVREHHVDRRLKETVQLLELIKNS